jgi:hypothetical protein
MQAWVVCRSGWYAGLGGMQVWVVCRPGWCAGLGGVQAWVVCKPGWCAGLGGVQACEFIASHTKCCAHKQSVAWAQ